LKLIIIIKPFIDIDKYKTQERENKFKKMNDPKTFGENHVTITAILITILER